MKSKRSFRITLVFLTILYFFVALLVESAQWFQNEWGIVSFATVVYQLSTPLAGTESGIIVSYCTKVLPLTLRRVILVVLFYYLFMRIFSVIDVKFNVKVFFKEFTVTLGKRFYVWGKCLFWLLLTGISVWEIGMKVVELGVDEFVSDVMQRSTIFEDYYVHPDDVEITFPEQKRNLIFIFMESMENTYASVEAGGGKPVNYIPELTKLAEDYVNISNTEKLGGVYSNALTGWTIAGLLGASSGTPYKIPGEMNSAGRYAEFLPGMVSLGDILEEEGYHNYFLFGSRGEFGARDLYYRKHGNYEIRDYFYAVDQGYIPEDYWQFWGYEDYKLFEIAKTELTEIAGKGEPFNYTMLTVDTHMPDGYICEHCENQYDQKYANAIACSSRLTYQFIEWVQAQEWYADTTIVLLGDHTSMANNFWDDIGDFERRTYNCFVNVPDMVDTSRVKNRDVCTLDIFPTTLAALGVKIEGDRLGLGTNVFSDRSTLIEEMGKTSFDKEISRYSKFYNDRLVQK